METNFNEGLTLFKNLSEVKVNVNFKIHLTLNYSGVGNFKEANEIMQSITKGFNYK